MPEITFIFGPNDSFFFDCPKAWKFHAVPQTLGQLFNSSMGPTWRIAQPYCVALAPATKSLKNGESLWYVGCKTLSGEDKLFYSQTHFERQYADLARWTKSIPNGPRAAFVTFGPNFSYFACAAAQGSIWGGIPPELQDTVRRASDTPSCVGLGKHNAWVVVYPDGNIAWRFYGYYTGLNKILTEAAPRSVEYVAISPYHKEHYFVAFRDDSIKYSFIGAPKEWMILMTEVFDAWAAERLQKQSLPFTQPFPQQTPYMQQPQQIYAQALSYKRPHPQQYQQVTAAAYNYPQHYQELPAHMPAQLPQYPKTSLGLIPGYHSPVAPQPAVSVNTYGGFIQAQGSTLEMPIELPGETLGAAAPPVPIRTVSTDKKKKFLSRLF